MLGLSVHPPRRDDVSALTCSGPSLLLSFPFIHLSPLSQPGSLKQSRPFRWRSSGPSNLLAPSLGAATLSAETTPPCLFLVCVIHPPPDISPWNSPTTGPRLLLNLGAFLLSLPSTLPSDDDGSLQLRLPTRISKAEALALYPPAILFRAQHAHRRRPRPERTSG